MLRKVLSYQSKIIRTYEHKMANNALSHMLLKFIINRVKRSSQAFYATLRTSLRAIWTTPE
jgi:hypothetical protein